MDPGALFMAAVAAVIATAMLRDGGPRLFPALLFGAAAVMAFVGVVPR